MFNEHPDDASEAYKILPGLPALLSDAHLLPPDIARMVHNFWAEAQKHDALVDRNKRAHALQSSDRDKLNKDLKESWCVLEKP